MKRPILWALIFLTGGILLGKTNNMVLLSLGFVLGVFICCCLYRQYRYLPVFLFIAFLLAGFLRMRQSMDIPLTQAAPLSLAGRVVETGFTASGNQRAVFVTEHNHQKLRVMVYIKPELPLAAPGQYIQISGTLRPLETPSNPGGYNELIALRSRKIDAKMFPDSVLTGEIKKTPVTILHGIKNKLAELYGGLLPEREAALVRSIILGDRSGLDDDIVELYRIGGIYHILSISGLHIGILMLSLNRFLSLFLNERKSGLIALSVMVVYCLLTGAAVPTVRAVIMGGVIVFGKILFREYDLPASASFACIVLLLYEPLYLYSAGFQLSFCAVFGIALLAGPVEHALTLARIPMPIRTALAFSAAATCSTYPVLSYHFYEISAYSIPVNMLIMPTASVLLVMGVLTGIAGLVWTPAAVFLSGAVFYILRFYQWICAFFAGLPFSKILTGGGDLLITAAAVTVILLFAYTFSGFGINLRRRGIALPCGFIFLFICVFIRSYPLGLHIDILYAGQGEYAVVRHRSQTYALAGGNGGGRELLQHLNYLGIKKADGLILTGYQEQAKEQTDWEKGEELLERFNAIYSANESKHAEVIQVRDGASLEAGKLFFDFICDESQMDVITAYNGIPVQFTRRPLMNKDAVIIWSPYENMDTDESQAQPRLWVLNGGNFWLRRACKERLRNRGGEVYSTDEDGAVRLKINGKNIEIRKMKGYG